MALGAQQQARIDEIDGALRKMGRGANPTRLALLDEKVALLDAGAAGPGPAADPALAAQIGAAAGRADRLARALNSYRWSGPDRALINRALTDELAGLPGGAWMPPPAQSTTRPIATLPADLSRRLGDAAMTGAAREAAGADLDTTLGSLGAPAGGDRA